jgi:hypothetical protein
MAKINIPARAKKKKEGKGLNRESFKETGLV